MQWLFFLRAPTQTGTNPKRNKLQSVLPEGFLNARPFVQLAFPREEASAEHRRHPIQRGPPPASAIRGKNDHNLRTSAAFRGCSPYSPPTLPISPDPFDTVAMQEESRTCGYKIPERAANATKHTDRCATRIATRKTCCEVSGQVDIPRATYIPQNRVRGKQTHTK